MRPIREGRGRQQDTGENRTKGGSLKPEKRHKSNVNQEVEMRREAFDVNQWQGVKTGSEQDKLTRP